MPTNRTRRTRKKNQNSELSESIIKFFDTGSCEPMTFDLFLSKKEQSEKYEIYKNKGFLDEFIKKNPGKRPYVWWDEATERHRTRTGGIGSPNFESFNYVPSYSFGVPDEFLTQEEADFYASQGSTLLGVPLDPDDPPQYETQTEYLRRHTLLCSWELKRI